jgi:hypothetical protein
MLNHQHRVRILSIIFHIHQEKLDASKLPLSLILDSLYYSVIILYLTSCAKAGSAQPGSKQLRLDLK